MSMSRAEDVRFYEKLLIDLTKKIKSINSFKNNLDKSDIFKKIAIVRHLIQKLKSEDKHFMDSVHFARLKQVYYMDLEHRSIEISKNKKEKNKTINPPVDPLHFTHLLCIQLEPKITLDKVCEEYLRFIADLLELKDKDDNPLYKESDFAYHPIGLMQPKPAFKFPNNEIKDLFVKILVMKDMIEVNEQNKTINIKNSLSIILQMDEPENTSYISPFKITPSPFYN